VASGVRGESTAPCSSAGNFLRLARYGPEAYLLSFAEQAVDSLAQRSRRLSDTVNRNPPPGLREVVPGLTNLLLEFVNSPDHLTICRWFERCRLAMAADFTLPPDRPRRSLREIPVDFSGPDLARVAAHSGLDFDAFLSRFIEARYTVQCLGFSPGFPYLTGLPASLETPRLSRPRIRVPAGSVAIGGSHVGIYPHASPGGWNLLGQTSVALCQWEANSPENMFLLQPGDQVSFTRLTGLPTPTPTPTPGPATGSVPEIAGDQNVGLLKVLNSGMGITIQDLGRPGYRRFGVPQGGAMDSSLVAAANRLLDNSAGDAVLELCGWGHRLEAQKDLWLAVAGLHARGCRATTLRLKAGERVDFSPDGYPGLWTYVATVGGFHEREFLGSVSASPRAGVGRMLQPGDILSAARPHEPGWPSAVARRSLPALVPIGLPIGVWPGPQYHLFPDSVRDDFFRQQWAISRHSDRVGFRLVGTPLSFHLDEMTSEPVLPGSIQVTPDGSPIVTMPDGPTLGGYPKLGLVERDNLRRLAQLPPGRSVKFELIGN